MLIVLLAFLFIQPAQGKDPPVYLNRLSLEAAQVMRQLASQDPKTLKTDAEKVEWAKARLAWIALLRLQGNEKEALSVFEGCGDWCERFGSEREWPPVKKWGCGKKKEANPCLLGKTKAQKPPR